MDHQQHYWYIKNSSRALQNTNNSIYLLNNPLSLVGCRRHLWLDDRRTRGAGGGNCRQRGDWLGWQHVKLIWLGGNHRPAERRNIHNNSLSREMRRPASRGPASPIEYFSELNRLLAGSVQFDEYWLETNMTKLHADPGATVSYGVTVWLSTGVGRGRFCRVRVIKCPVFLCQRSLRSTQRDLLAFRAEIKPMLQLLIFSLNNFTELWPPSPLSLSGLNIYWLHQACQLMVSIRQKLTNSLSKLLIIFSLSKFLSLIFFRLNLLINDRGNF